MSKGTKLFMVRRHSEQKACVSSLTASLLLLMFMLMCIMFMSLPVPLQPLSPLLWVSVYGL